MSSSFANSLRVVLAVFVQATLAPVLSYHGALPSLVALVVVLAALRYGIRSTLAIGALAGVLTDALAGTAGGWTIAYLAISAASGAARSRFFADGIVMPSLLVLGAVLLRNAIFWSVMTAEGYPRGYGTAHLHAAVLQALMTGALAVVVQVVRARFAEPAPRMQRYA